MVEQQGSLSLDLSQQLRAFSLRIKAEIPRQGVTVIFGHSGCGKTTLLRCIAGLTKAHGVIRFGDQVWQDETVFEPPHRRPIGYVFQEARLFPHLTTEQNLQFASKRASQSLALSAEDIIELLDLTPLLGQPVTLLSGGEQQRVAIARALLIAPRLLLMDEPLAALDLARKQEILTYLERLKEEVKLPIVYVTHAVDELARLADQLLVLDRGQRVAQGTLNQVLTQLHFPVPLGDERGVVMTGQVVVVRDEWGLAKVVFEGGAALWIQAHEFQQGQWVRVRILARDVSVALCPAEGSSILNVLPAKVDAIVEEPDSPMALLRAKVGAAFVLCRLTRRSVHQLRLAPGLKVWLQIKSAALVS